MNDIISDISIADLGRNSLCILKMLQVLITLNTGLINVTAQCARMDLNKRFLPKPMTTTG